MVFYTQFVDGWWSWEPLRQLFFSAGLLNHIDATVLYCFLLEISISQTGKRNLYV